MNYLIIAIVIVILSMIRQVNQYQQGVLYRLGKFQKILGPGWHIIIPVFQYMKIVDVRVKAVDVPDQDAITKDNVSIKVNAVLYFNVSEPIYGQYLLLLHFHQNKVLVLNYLPKQA